MDVYGISNIIELVHGVCKPTVATVAGAVGVYLLGTTMAFILDQLGFVALISVTISRQSRAVTWVL